MRYTLSSLLGTALRLPSSKISAITGSPVTLSVYITPTKSVVFPLTVRCKSFVGVKPLSVKSLARANRLSRATSSRSDSCCRKFNAACVRAACCAFSAAFSFSFWSYICCATVMASPANGDNSSRPTVLIAISPGRGCAPMEPNPRCASARPS